MMCDMPHDHSTYLATRHTVYYMCLVEGGGYPSLSLWQFSFSSVHIGLLSGMPFGELEHRHLKLILRSQALYVEFIL